MKTESRSVRIRAALLAWYDTNRRDLPWRRSPDPYRVWISEIMLQQTRVAVVIPYYERWLDAFPDISALATADLHDVLKQWEGLGYYSRARNLHGAARLVREKHGGLIPSENNALRALPGVGEYTAGAIASIAYNRPTPAIDGNARRIVARLFDMPDPRVAQLRQHTESLLDPKRPGDFNQALMDLGASVCTPRAPACGACPLAALCRARMRGTTHLRPAPARRSALPHYQVTTLIYVRKQHVLLEQRPSVGLLGGLWQFPECAEPPDGARAIGKVTHTFSHQRITYCVHEARRPPRPGANQRWVKLGETAAYPMSTAQRRIEQLIESAD